MFLFKLKLFLLFFRRLKIRQKAMYLYIMSCLHLHLQLRTFKNRHFRVTKFENRHFRVSTLEVSTFDNQHFKSPGIRKPYT